MKAFIASIALLFFMAGAHADVIVIVNPAASPLSKEQVSDIFLGKNQHMTPFDLPEASPVRAEFYTKVIGRDIVQIKSAWARLVFSGRGWPPRDFPDAEAVKKAVAADPKAVGYIDKSALDSSVKAALTIN